MQTIVHYEVYVLEQRGWELHSRHPSAERAAALEEAKGIEQYTGKAVRVVRETYFPTLNSSEEIVSYVSPHAGRQGRQSDYSDGYAGRGAGHAGGGGQWLAPDDPFDLEVLDPRAAGGRRRARRSAARLAGTGGVMLRLLAILAGCLALAGGVTVMTSMALDRMPTVGRASGDNADILFPVFMAVFMLTTIPLVITFVPVSDPGLPSVRGRRVGRPLWERVSAWLRPNPPADADGDQAGPPDRPEIPQDRLADLDMDLDLDPVDLDPPAAEPEADDAHAMDLSLQLDDLDAEDQRDAEDLDAPAADDGEHALPDNTLSEDTLDASEASDARRVLVAFLGGALAAVQQARPQLDAFNRFGLNLVVYGGCDALTASARLKPDEVRPLVMETARILGVPKAAAGQFHARLETYLAEPKYLRMVQAGRVAMDRFARGGGSTAFSDLPAAFEAWNAPMDLPAVGAEPTAAHITTVMFTDIVGSTALTQTHGDRGAHRFVRVHNDIVRDILARFNGREVKHTGDGIMAAFASAGAAVRSAIEIQQAVSAHGGATPDDAFWLRIGLNSGEPLEDEDDLFGTTVQLAARVCARASPGQILISNVLRELCAGKPFTTRDQGLVKLKGFAEPQHLHEVVWAGSGTAGTGGRDGGTDRTEASQPQAASAADTRGHAGRQRSNVA